MIILFIFFIKKTSKKKQEMLKLLSGIMLKLLSGILFLSYLCFTLAQCGSYLPEGAIEQGLGPPNGLQPRNCADSKAWIETWGEQSFIENFPGQDIP